MSETNLTDVDIPRSDLTVLGQLNEHLGDLILAHWQGQSETKPLSEHLERASVSLHLIGLEYVCGERSGARSYMRFDLLVKPEGPGHVAETFTLECVVRQGIAKCLARS